MSTSTTSVSATKGEKGKSKYAALNINNLYKVSLCSSLRLLVCFSFTPVVLHLAYFDCLLLCLLQGNSIEPQAKAVAPKHGMQSLGKVPSARRAPQPVNLPSLKSEGTSGPENSIETSKPSSGTPAAVATASVSATTVPNQPTAPNSASAAATTAAGWTGSAPELSAAVKPQSPAPSAPVLAVPVALAAPVAVPVATASSVPTDARTAFLDRKFQQEFPSLTSEPPQTSAPSIKKNPTVTQPPPPTPVQDLPARQDSPQPTIQYGPGPSLRPQTEGSWVQGGGRTGPLSPGSQGEF